MSLLVSFAVRRHVVRPSPDAARRGRRARGRRPRPASALAVIAVVVLALIAAGCGGAAATFDPSAPCDADTRLPGAYPDLEAMLPAELGTAAPASVDSGRNCTEKALGTMAGRGIDELRFAGGIWERTSRSGTTLALFVADSLTDEILGEWYLAGATSTTKAEKPELTRPEVDGEPGVRIDTLVNESDFSSVVLWPGDEPGFVRAVLVATDIRELTRQQHEDAVVAAITAFGSAIDAPPASPAPSRVPLPTPAASPTAEAPAPG